MTAGGESAPAQLGQALHIQTALEFGDGASLQEGIANVEAYYGDLREERQISSSEYATLQRALSEFASQLDLGAPSP